MCVCACCALTVVRGQVRVVGGGAVAEVARVAALAVVERARGRSADGGGVAQTGRRLARRRRRPATPTGSYHITKHFKSYKITMEL